MSSKRSGGILAFRLSNSVLEVLLVHPGGPYWKNKNQNAWSIPKGLIEDAENELEGAIREFQEETGFEISTDKFIELDEVRQPSGKTVKVWAVEADYDVSKLKSNSFKMEWPPGSGKLQEFPEADRADWFELHQAKIRIVKGQISILDQLYDHLEESKQ